MKYYKTNTKRYVFIDSVYTNIKYETSYAYNDTPIKLDYKDIICKASAGTKKITNFIDTTAHIAGIGFCFDSKMKELLSEFNIPQYQIFPLEVNFKNELFQYYWFRLLVNPLKNVVDFEKSTFIHHETGKPFPLIFEELRRIKFPPNIIQLEALGAIPKEIAIYSEFEHYDMLSFGNPLQYYVSERLKNALEKNKITGIEFKEISTKIV